MSRYQYNVIVIGAGAAGLVSAYIAAAAKAKVALIERDQMGGDCLNTGCVPSKALIKAAKVAHQAKHSMHLGIHTELKVDFQQTMQHVHDAIKAIEPHDSVARYTELGVECFQGEAQLISPHEVKVRDTILTARSIIIAAGAEPFIPNYPELPEHYVLSSDTIWQLKELPENLLVVGGGPIGVELAQAFSRLGSNVTIAQRNKRLLPKEEPEASALILKQLEDEGITVLLEHELETFTAKGKPTAHFSHFGDKTAIDFDYVLFALGRKARIDQYNGDALGIKVRHNGTVEANDFLQTNIPNIYVCGDITGPYQFTHVAAHQAWYACVNALASPFKRFKVDYSVIPRVTYCDPEVASVGITEAEAKALGRAIEITEYNFEELDRAITETHTRGFIKVITLPGKDKILGVTIVGDNAGETLAEFTLAMRHGLGLNKILGTIHPYPTYSEANKYVAGNWRKKHMPGLALKLAEKFHQWRR